MKLKNLAKVLLVLGRSNYITGAIASAPLGKTIGPIETNQGYAILQVHEISKFDSTAYETKKSQIKNTLFSKNKTNTSKLGCQILKDQAEIIDNRKLLFLTKI